jgi:hypothetical protein
VTVRCLSPGKAPRSALHLDDLAPLGVLSTPIGTQWKGPRLGETCASAVHCKCLGRTNRLFCVKIKFERVINSGSAILAMRWLSTGAR